MLSESLATFMQRVTPPGYNLTISQRTHLEQVWESLYAVNQFSHAQTVESILSWLAEKRKSYVVTTSEIGIDKLDKWNVDPQSGVISHQTGKFFQIIGVKVEGAKGREVLGWSQPMMKQQECGILGILCQKFNGIRHYLLYAKYEPGNRNTLQLSPTLQATASNLSQAHGGTKPLFAEFFEEGGKGTTLTNIESVEDGGRFYLKTNRNVLVEVDENERVNVSDDFIWVTYPQLKELLQRDLVVNSLARSVMGSW
ncbi:TPA: response regulator receiver protein [Candidatus Woesearchaeota archaeon]|nr:response regulator receiver protein [Candidatus Woesearchaeota archaeon]